MAEGVLASGDESLSKKYRESRPNDRYPIETHHRYVARTTIDRVDRSRGVGGGFSMRYGNASTKS